MYRFLSDFPRMDHRSEDASRCDFALFMDGFLYISSREAKATSERRGRDGESPNRSAVVVHTAPPSEVRSTEAPREGLSDVMCSVGLALTRAGLRKEEFSCGAPELLPWLVLELLIRQVFPLLRRCSASGGPTAGDFPGPVGN